MANNTNGKEVFEGMTIESNGKCETTGAKQEKKYKLITTWILCFISLVYGLTSYAIGPALNDMRLKLHTTTDSITIVFGSILIGYILGAVISGIIFNYINRQLVLTFLLFLMAATITLAPYCPNLGTLFADTCFCGFGGGGIDTAQVVWIIEMWADQSSVYLAGYQFFFAVGTFVSPLITRPFLAEELTTFSNQTQANQTFISSTSSSDEPKLSNHTNSHNLTQPVITYTESHLEIPFGIIGSLLLTSGIILLSLHFYRRYEPPVEQNEQFVRKCPDKWKLIYIILGIFTLAPYVGMEVTNFQLVATFAKYCHLEMSGADSALVQSIMAGSFALSRGIILVITLKYWSEKTLYLNLATIFAGNTIVLLFQLNGYSKAFLWAGVILFGAGSSSMFPSVYAFLETQFTVSNTIGGLFVCISGLMGAILSVVCGQFIEDEPLALVYVNYACASLIATSFTIFNVLIYFRSKSNDSTKDM